MHAFSRLSAHDGLQSAENAQAMAHFIVRSVEFIPFKALIVGALGLAGATVTYRLYYRVRSDFLFVLVCVCIHVCTQYVFVW